MDNLPTGAASGACAMDKKSHQERKLPMRTLTEKIDELKSIMFQALKVSGQTGVFSMELVQKLESLIEQREREACARECDIQASFGNDDERFGARQCAHAIRTRGRA